jgi:hypothetical protein
MLSSFVSIAARNSKIYSSCTICHLPSYRIRHSVHLFHRLYISHLWFSTEQSCATFYALLYDSTQFLSLTHHGHLFHYLPANIHSASVAHFRILLVFFAISTYCKCCLLSHASSCLRSTFERRHPRYLWLSV